MADIPTDAPAPSRGLKIPSAIINIAATAAGIFIVVYAGSALVQQLPPSPWNTAAAYAIPALVVWLAYRWMVQRL